MRIFLYTGSGCKRDALVSMTFDFAETSSFNAIHNRGD